MTPKTKYFSRRIIAMFLIASPCYVWSKTIILLGFIGLAYVLPDGDYYNDTQSWVYGMQLVGWIVMFTIGWYGSKLLITKPKEMLLEVSK